jgi:hypothetical protein
MKRKPAIPTGFAAHDFGTRAMLQSTQYPAAAMDFSKWTLVELMRGTPSWTRVQRARQGKTTVTKKPSLMINDLITLAVAGATILKTNPELKGENRRKLRTAVNRAQKFVETV